jgi:tyrosine-protein kinase Etk/Wzc
MAIENPGSFTPSPAPPALAAAPRAPAAGSRPVRGDALTFKEVARSILEGRWIVLAVTAAALAGAALYLFLAPPVYRAVALLQIDEEASGISGLEKLAAVLDKTPSEGEMEIMRSRLVVAPVVADLALDVLAEPRHVPILGDALARRHRGPGVAAPLFNRPSFAWGGEKIAVGKLEVSEDLLNQELTLTSLDDARYQVTDEDGALLIEGKVGAPAKAQQGSRRIELLVTELVARPQTEFLVERRRRNEVVDELQARLTIEERGKKTGVVAIQLDGGDPSRVSAVVSSLASSYLEQHKERRTGEAAKTLEFLDRQLPAVRAQVEDAEAALKAYRLERRTVDLPTEQKTTVDRVAKLDADIAAAELDLLQARKKYTDRHPDVVALDHKVAGLRDERGAVVTGPVRALPDTELGATRLVRNVNVATELYLLLLNKAQALRVAKSGTLGNVRVVDWPVVARRPVRPVPGPVVILAALLGLGGGLAAAIARRSLSEGAEDCQDIEAATGLPVFVTVPHSVKETQLERRSGHGGRSPIALAAPEDAATESLRTLRTSLGFILRARGRVIAISSLSSSVGKTFVCANLGHLLAAAGKRVLLVDADLRRGSLHRSCGVAAQPGLSEVLEGSAPFDAAVRASATPGLSVLPCGSMPRQPAELLAGARLQEVLAAAAQRFDVVLVDTPPTLAVTDPLLVARWASVNLLVLRARQHPIREIALALERYAQTGVTVDGAILNDARAGNGYGRLYDYG